MIFLGDTESDLSNLPPELRLHFMSKEQMKKQQEQNQGQDNNYDPDHNEDYILGEFLQQAKEVDWQEDFKNYVGEEKNMKKLRDFIPHNRKLGLDTEVDYQKYDPKSLNEKQGKAFTLMTNWCKKAAQDKDGDLPPLYLILQGRAGCGKSYLVNCVKKYTTEELDCPKLIQVAAPTGTAAFNVSGSTIHSLLQLPVPTPKTNPVPDLSSDQLRRLQMDFRGCKMLVIDEMSMMSPLRLYQIDQRLRQARPEHSDKPFGNIAIVLMGDFAQLPPVMEKSLYDEPLIEHFAAQGKLAYEKFNNVIILDTIMRQIGPEQQFFRDCLNSLANGTLDQAQWRELCKRDLELMEPAERERFRKDALVLCSKNDALKTHNINRIKDLGTPIAPINAKHTGLGSYATSSQAGGLPKTTLLAKGSRVYLTSNEWKDAGKMFHDKS